MYGQKNIKLVLWVIRQRCSAPRTVSREMLEAEEPERIWRETVVA